MGGGCYGKRIVPEIASTRFAFPNKGAHGALVGKLTTLTSILMQNYVHGKDGTKVVPACAVIACAFSHSFPSSPFQ
jgi:hypothetical protein